MQMPYHVDIVARNVQTHRATRSVAHAELHQKRLEDLALEKSFRPNKTVADHVKGQSLE